MKIQYNYKLILKILIFIAFIANSLVHLYMFPTYGVNESGGDIYEKINFSFHKNYAQSLNVDEKEMARVAFYYLDNKGFVTDLSFGRPKFRKDSVFVSALRPKFNILLHIVGLKIYGKDKISTANNIPETYFYYYGFVLAIIKLLVFYISIWAFFKIANSLFNENLSLLITLLYILYPSIFMFINIHIILENIGLSLLIIVYSRIIKILNAEKCSNYEIILSSLIALLACLIRPHILVILMLTLVFILISSWYLKNKILFKYAFVCGSFIIIGHIPILYQNYKDFNAIFLSTQPGMEFFQGHNEYARGSWQPGIWTKYEKELQPMFDSEPNLKNMNEKEELDFYKKQSMIWIKNNPLKELELIARKTAIYFLPFNFLHKKIDVFLILTYLGFIGFLVLRLWFFKSLYKPIRIETFILALLVIPFIGSYFLNIYFFIGERWRYYAEPFMLILAFYFYYSIYKYFKNKSVI